MPLSVEDKGDWDKEIFESAGDNNRIIVDGERTAKLALGVVGLEKREGG